MYDEIVYLHSGNLMKHFVYNSKQVCLHFGAIFNLNWNKLCSSKIFNNFFPIRFGKSIFQQELEQVLFQKQDKQDFEQDLFQNKINQDLEQVLFQTQSISSDNWSKNLKHHCQL